MTEARERRETEADRGEYTVVGILDDGDPVGRAAAELKALGGERDDLTVILKRQDPEEPESLPEDVRYIIVPDNSSGMEVPIGFAIVFVVVGLFFAITTPAIGIPTFIVFISLAAILIAGSFTRVGVAPILIDMEAPREESGFWNDEFEEGKTLVFQVVRDREHIRRARDIIQKHGGSYYIVERKLEPKAVSGAVLHRVRASGGGERVSGAQGA
ncbi:hypothetical protein E0L93_01225 [Rubrobacter taiwanensis]|uniref:Uncharacterized protein n=1 Tax=Rubrobacter taiwanensis TaxID=185139 RepID=A0A4R1BRQ9_9ACTN|nr:hypothetical protein [Rubrobacter taiwanensis]TCJ20473.1 hypothetical protein E0L93_01225 [Rubrobacter taiwanensis]